MIHFPNGKNRDLAGIRLDQFDGADGTLSIARIDIHNHHFGAHVLHLAQHRVGRAGREPGVAEDIAAHSGALQTMLEYR